MHARSDFVVLCLAFGILPSLALPCGASRAEKPSPKSGGAGPSEGQKGPSLGPIRRWHREKRMDFPPGTRVLYQSPPHGIWETIPDLPNQGPIVMHTRSNLPVTVYQPLVIPPHVIPPHVIPPGSSVPPPPPPVHLHFYGNSIFVPPAGSTDYRTQYTNPPKTTTSLHRTNTNPSNTYTSSSRTYPTNPRVNEWVAAQSGPENDSARSPSVVTSKGHLVDKLASLTDKSVQPGSSLASSTRKRLQEITSIVTSNLGSKGSKDRSVKSNSARSQSSAPRGSVGSIRHT